MKAEELRIGNHVECDDINYVVIGIDPERLRVIDSEADPSMLNIINAKPILITPELLEKSKYIKLGYISDMARIEYYDMGLIIFYPKGLSISILARNGDWFILDAQVKYVHQLQNVYYALTSQELNITL